MYLRICVPVSTNSERPFCLHFSSAENVEVLNSHTIRMRGEVEGAKGNRMKGVCEAVLNFLF